jgi:hypothetical protein
MPRHILQVFTAGLIAAAAALVGCGKPGGQVTGKVTHHGQAVVRANIVFNSESDAAEVFYGASNDEGKYTLDTTARGGLTPGKYKVVVTDYVQRDGSPLPAGEAGASLRDSEQVVTRRHQLSKDVAAGPNEIELKLEEGQVLPAEEF